jgi:hypothetical protein
MISDQTHWLLRLYPETWRERYGDEFAALLEQCRLSPMTLFDVLLGALDARIKPQDTTGRILQMIERPRRTAITVFCAYIAFVVAGMGYQKMTEDVVKARIGDAHPAIGISFLIVEIGAAVALLAVLAGGLPIAYTALRQALAARRRDIFVLFAVPPVALAVWLGYTALLLSGHHPPALLDIKLPLSWIGLFLLAAIASTAAVSIAAARSAIGEQLLRFALGSAVVTTLAMAVMFAAVLVWGLALRADAPQIYNGNDGALATNTVVSWVALVVVMGVATVVAAAALIRGFTAQRTTVAVA